MKTLIHNKVKDNIPSNSSRNGYGCIDFLQSFRDFYIEKNNSKRAQKYAEKLIYLQEHYPELFNVSDK